jgi:hypothetical protein
MLGKSKAVPIRDGLRLPPVSCHLRRGRLFRHDPYLVVGDLEKPSLYVEPFPPSVGAEPERPLTKQRHHRRVSGENTDLTIERRSDDGVDLAFEEDPLWGDDGDMQHSRPLLRFGQAIGVLDHFVDPASHKERLFRVLIELAGHQTLE